MVICIRYSHAEYNISILETKAEDYLVDFVVSVTNGTLEISDRRIYFYFQVGILISLKIKL